MRKTLRKRQSQGYWQSRWLATPVDAPAQGTDRYPLRHANIVVSDDEAGEVLELGCGPGRLLRAYHDRGIGIVGVDNVSIAIEKLRALDPSLKVEVADGRSLPFEDEHFSVVLCFGVYHCIEEGPHDALRETFRVLRKGGKLCAEFRADNFHNYLIDAYKGAGQQADQFHKWNYSRQEARNLLFAAGFEVIAEMPAINMPLLYHLPVLRHPSQRGHDEHACRAQGYRLRPWLEALLALAMRLTPNAICNEHIFICHKPV